MLWCHLLIHINIYNFLTRLSDLDLRTIAFSIRLILPCQSKMILTNSFFYWLHKHTLCSIKITYIKKPNKNIYILLLHFPFISISRLSKKSKNAPIVAYVHCSSFGITLIVFVHLSVCFNIHSKRQSVGELLRYL